MGCTFPVKKLYIDIFIKATHDRKYVKALSAGGLAPFLLPACRPAGSTWGHGLPAACHQHVPAAEGNFCQCKDLFLTRKDP